MAKIGRSFDELDSRIKQFNTDIKTADAGVKQLDKSLKLNPGSVDSVRQKYALLSQNLQTNTQKLAALQQKQKALTADFNSGAITQDTYNRQLAKTQKEVQATERNIEQLTIALRGQNAAIQQANYTKLINGMDKAEAKAKKLSTATLAVVGAFTALMKMAIDTGDELADNATHYGTTAENLQVWSNRLGMLAKDQEAYTSSLDKVGSMLTSITAGRGARYLTYLKQLGLSQEDVANKTNAEVFELIYQGLREVTDETERTIIAQGLLGEAGLEIAVIAGTEQDAIESLDEALYENGIITNEQAAAADEAANKILALKQSASAASAELLVAAMPTIESFINLLKNTLVPALNKLTGWFADMTPRQQKMLLVLLMMIIALPKIIALVKGVVGVMHLIKTATYAQAAAQTTLTAATAPFLPIILAISAALLLLITIIGMFIGASNDAVDSANGLLAKLEEVDAKTQELSGDTEYSATTTYETNNSRELHIDVDVNATGDGTAIGSENAEAVADALYDKMITDLVNQELGEVIR